jgi:antitoxin component of MazEF toxin-antitoxin module
MKITISKCGEGFGVRIPSSLLKSAGFAVGDQIDAEAHGKGEIVLQAMGRVRVKNDIDALISKITPETLPDVYDLDSIPVGREIW